MHKYIFVFVLICIAGTKQTFAWDNDELEIFDLVEEINENFYKILNVEQVSEIKSLKF